jgi:tRNA modification GTPase
MLRSRALLAPTVEDLRQAQQALSEITGAYSPDDLLGETPARFCIGK